MGYFITNIHHKTISKTLPVRFYVFQDTTNPPILLSYSASERLGIIEFKIPNEAPSTVAVDTISTTKKVTFSNLLETGKSIRGSHKTTLKSAIKIKPFQDHTSHTIGNKPSQDKQSSQHPRGIKTTLFKTIHQKEQKTAPSKTIHHGSRTPLKTIHYKTILLQKMLKIYFH